MKTKIPPFIVTLASMNLYLHEMDEYYAPRAAFYSRYSDDVLICARTYEEICLFEKKFYEFLDRLFNVALPRVRDFRGINPNSFDGRGNYALGLKEQLIFPEIDYDKIDKVRGMDIVFVTTAQNDEEARELLTLMGAPFEK